MPGLGSARSKASAGPLRGDKKLCFCPKQGPGARTGGGGASSCCPPGDTLTS